MEPVTTLMRRSVHARIGAIALKDQRPPRPLPRSLQRRRFDSSIAEDVVPSESAVARWLDDLYELERAVLRKHSELTSLETAHRRFHAGITLIPIDVINRKMETVRASLALATLLYEQRVEELIAMGIHIPVLPNRCLAGIDI